MADPSLYTYPSPLEGFDRLEPLSDEKNEDGKSYKNIQTGKLSKSYETFTDGLDNGTRGGFDVHGKPLHQPTIDVHTYRLSIALFMRQKTVQLYLPREESCSLRLM
jgi:hypothetical protein